jgi:predicted DsbA family dithiol-disulfide isomerase
MKTTSLLLLAAALLACAARSSPAPAPDRAAAPPVTADDPEAVLPGVSLEGLSPEAKRAVAELALSEFCYCGCPHTLSQCLRTHDGCAHARREVELAVRLARAGAPRPELQRLLGEYYASFDRRARLDVGDFGPPLGGEAAPVTLVEFSDFTCPYCQVLRPVLEGFVAERGERVRLFYKPFPIESHPGALEAAQAAEWARDQGLFWPMHDALFASPHDTSIDALADHARAVGGDPSDLRDALTTRRYERKVRGSQTEARAAGIRGTPTLFFSGRRYTIPDFSEDALERTLQDEEEWQKHKGWERD